MTDININDYVATKAYEQLSYYILGMLSEMTKITDCETMKEVLLSTYQDLEEGLNPE